MVMATSNSGTPPVRPPRRALACVACQRRKVKCNRESPCQHCARAGVACTPATPVGEGRRRRFPERELLDRVRRYEETLRQHGIDFEPLHTRDAMRPSPGETVGSRPQVIAPALVSQSKSAGGVSPAEDARIATYHPEKSSTESSLTGTRDLYDAMHQAVNTASDESDREDDVGETVVRKVWDRMDVSDDLLHFDIPVRGLQTPTRRPETHQIFKLWQVYIERVDPLLKVTHVPSLQARIVDTISGNVKVSPELEALMFSIYCAAVMTLDEDECQTIFAAAKEAAVAPLRFECRQALLICGVLRSSDRDCLTALFLYLVRLLEPDMQCQD